jgi:hypothetical protein
VPFLIERKNCIVDNAFDQSLEVAFDAVEHQSFPFNLTDQLVLHRKQMGFSVLARRNCRSHSQRRHRYADGKYQ